MRSVSYTHLRAHETVLDLVCRLLLEKKNITRRSPKNRNVYTIITTLDDLYAYYTTHIITDI